MKPIRVAVLTSAHPAFDIRIFQKEARTLAAAGYEVTLVAPHDRDEQVDGVRLRAFDQPGARLVRILTSAPRMLRAALRVEADIHHFHDPELIPVGLALKLLRRRVIYDAHEDLPKSIMGKTYLPSWARRPLALAVGLFEKAASRAFDLVVVAGEGIQSSFRGHPRTLVIRNYPMQDWFADVSRGERGEIGFTAVYSGALTLGRGAMQMAEAMTRLPARLRPRLVILGQFRPDTLEQQVRAAAPPDRVDFRGWVAPAALVLELQRADVGLACLLPEPNHIESGPNKLFEYMAAGLPVVGSNFPSWREILEGNHCGLCVDPTDPGAIAAALEHLADHPEERAAMGANGRRAVLERYNWEAEGRRLVQAYAAIR